MRLISRSSISAFLISLGMPGSMPSTFCSGPIFFTCCIWSRKSSSVSWPLRSFCSAFSISSWSKVASAFSMSVSTSPMPRMRLGHAVGVERLELVELLAGTGEEDRLADDLLHRQRGAAARVAVDLGEDHAVEADGLVELGGDVHRFLAGHRVDDEQRVVGLARRRAPGAARPSARRRSADDRRCRRSRRRDRAARLLRARRARPRPDRSARE